MKTHKNFIAITSEDLEKSFKLGKGSLEEILGRRKEENKEEGYYQPDLYREVHDYILERLYKKRQMLYGSLLKLAPHSGIDSPEIKGENKNRYPGNLNDPIIRLIPQGGFDSPEVEDAFKQQLRYRKISSGRLESYIRNDPNEPPKPIYVSQEEINRMYGVPGVRVLGLYFPDTDEIYIVENLTSEEEYEVYEHELEHWRDPSAPEWVVQDRMRRRGFHIFH